MEKLRTITLSGQNFRSEILGSTTKGVSLLVPFHIQFAQPKITQGDVACIIKKYVLRLQIPTFDNSRYGAILKLLWAHTCKRRHAHASVQEQEATPRYRTCRPAGKLRFLDSNRKPENEHTERALR